MAPSQASGFDSLSLCCSFVVTEKKTRDQRRKKKCASNGSAMAMWHRPDTQCPVVALGVQRGEGWSDFGVNGLLGCCLAGGSSAVIDVLLRFLSKTFPVLH